MTRTLGLGEAADHFDIRISIEELQNIEAQLDEELAGIQAVPDAIESVNVLNETDVRVAVCSNLARPYGAAVRRLFPQMDAYGFSYEIGYAKPSPEIYLATCRLLDVQPCSENGEPRLVMVGDSQRCDRDGPQIVGIGGFFLDRSGRTGFGNLQEFVQFVLANDQN